MKLFEVREADKRTRSPRLAVRRAAGLPGIRCDVCGDTWSTTGVAYPSVEIGVLPKRVFTRGPVSLAEFLFLRDEIIRALGKNVPLPPGTGLGPLSGTTAGVVERLEWLNPWTLLLSSSAVVDLRSYGVLFDAAPVRLSTVGSPATRLALYEIAIPPSPSVDVEGTADEVSVCHVCGFTRIGRPEQLRVHLTGSNSESDLLRPANFPTLILATDRFVDAADACHLPNVAFDHVVVIEDP
jgi:uncharacterized double-CXXCG motif protein